MGRELVFPNSAEFRKWSQPVQGQGEAVLLLNLLFLFFLFFPVVFSVLPVGNTPLNARSNLLTG